jgi:hypothetical protein
VERGADFRFEISSRKLDKRNDSPRTSAHVQSALEDNGFSTPDLNRSRNPVKQERQKTVR